MWFDEACFRLFFMLLRGLSCCSFFLSLHFSFFLIPSSVFPFFFFSFFKLPDSRLLISFVALTVPFCTLFLIFSGSQKGRMGSFTRFERLFTIYQCRRRLLDSPSSIFSHSLLLFAFVIGFFSISFLITSYICAVLLCLVLC